MISTTNTTAIASDDESTDLLDLAFNVTAHKQSRQLSSSTADTADHPSLGDRKTSTARVPSWILMDGDNARIEQHDHEKTCRCVSQGHCHDPHHKPCPHDVPHSHTGHHPLQVKKVDEHDNEDSISRTKPEEHDDEIMSWWPDARMWLSL